MIKRLVLLLLIVNVQQVHAQTIKTDVLVIGGGASGVAAAVQCSRSKVKTVLAMTSSAYGNLPATDEGIIDCGNEIPSGIWAEFRSQALNLDKNTIAETNYTTSLKLKTEVAASILQKLTDSAKNLTVYQNAVFTSIKKDGDRWDVTLIENKKTVKVEARAVIDATEDGFAAARAGARTMPLDDNFTHNITTAYRTSIGCGEILPNKKHTATGAYPPQPFYCIPVKAVVAQGVQNLLVTEKLFAGETGNKSLSRQLILGHGAGTVAAYCAFFKTTTANLKVRVIQGELLDFRGNLLPFADVPQNDHDWRAIQQVCATGLLRGVQQTEGKRPQFIFEPDSPVNTAEVKPVLTEIYTRAFLWFGKEKPGQQFTLGNLLSFISDYTLTDPPVLIARVQRDWQERYKLKTSFDINRPVSRREFAVLANKYLNPFGRTIDLDGRLVN